MEKLWMIKIPYSSLNLKNQTNTNIVIYELNKIDSSNTYAECYIRFTVKNGAFIIKDTHDSYYIHQQKIYDEIVKNSGDIFISENIFFTSKELAYISFIFTTKCLYTFVFNCVKM